MIPWYFWAIMSALAASIMDIFTKKSLEKVHAMEFRTTFKIMQIPLLVLLIPFISFDMILWEYIIIFAIALTAVIGGIFWCKAIRHSEISSVMPMKNISPVFLVVLAYFFLCEVLSWRQGLGIFILVIGTYVLEVDHKISDLKGPLNKILKTKSMHYVLIALFIYSLSAVGDKYVLNFTNKFTYLFWVWFFMIIINYLISVIYYDGYKDIKYCIKKSGWTIWIVSLASFIAALTYLKALEYAFVTLVIPIKRLSTLFSTFIGGEIFHDHGLRLRVVACIILIIGSLLIVI